MKVFKKGGKEAEATKTAPNTPEEEDAGVTVVANEIDPVQDLLSPLTMQQIPSPLRGDHRSTSFGDHRSTSYPRKKSPSEVREEKKEDPLAPRDPNADDVVSKTLNFFEDMCNMPQIPEIASEGGATSSVSIKNQRHLLINQESCITGMVTNDDYTYSPSLPSETTGNTSADPSTRGYSTSHVSANINNNKKKLLSNKADSQNAAHNHENFEVVLDPASIPKEEKQTAKQQRGQRWKDNIKSLTSSISQKKEKNDGSGPVSENKEALTPNREEVDDAPLDEEIGRLLGANESDGADEKEPKSSTGVGGPKVLAKKIWKKAKKIPTALHKGELQSHRAEVDCDAAVARSLEAKKATEDQDIVQTDPKDDMDPLLEGHETEEDNAELCGADTPSMANAWNNIIGSVTNTTEPDATSNKSPGANDPETRENATPEPQRKTEEAVVPAGQSVEVSTTTGNKKPQRRGTSLGRRLKKIQVFKSKKGDKKGVKQSSDSKLVSSASTDSSSELVQKPKQVWKAVVDPNTGRTYYYHRKTRETTWTKPEAFARYEVEYKKWLDTTAAASNETALDEKKDETPREVLANDGGNAMLHSSTPPVSTIPLQMPDSPVKAAKKQDSKPKQENVVRETKKVERAADKETKAAPEKIKQTVDESKPFDEATPFDEPMSDNGPGLLFLPRSPARFGRTMTYMSKASARSALTDRTEKIKNTGKGKFSAFNSISENVSSNFDDPAYRVPSRVPVHRERQLMVEELTDARLNAESYEGNAGERRGRIVRGRATEEVEPTPEVMYDGDNDTLDDYGTSTYDNDTYGTDSVSALSENDTDFLSRRDNFDQARRRALDAAIEIEDWDLAAALSDGMRAVNLPGGYEKAHSSWNQSELDKFIANNDWTAVKSYIARMRDLSKKEQATGASSFNKRLGSQSQIQHRDVLSESSWSGSDSQSSYDDETYDSESEI